MHWTSVLEVEKLIFPTDDFKTRTSHEAGPVGPEWFWQPWGARAARLARGANGFLIQHNGSF